MLIRRQRPSKLVSSGNHMHVAATTAHFLAGVRDAELFLKMTNPIERPNKARFINALRRAWHGWAFKRAHKVLLIARPTWAEYERTFPAAAGKFEVVDNPYITDEMLAGRAGPDEFDQGRLIAIGRLVPQKNYPLLLAALSKIRHLLWMIDILGDGPLLAQLQEQANGLGIARRVNFQGYVNDPVPLLRRAHALVLSSDWEGQGAVLLEALVCGSPVIATRSTDAVASVLDDGRYGTLVPPGDAEALADAIAAELTHRSQPPGDTRDWFARYRIEAGVRSHARALGLRVSRD